MSFGEHLEELRSRLIRSIIGVGVAVVFCLLFAEEIIAFLCQPLVVALSMAGLPPRLYQEQVAQLFLNYMQVSLLAAVIVASPWVIYQIWKFVSAGLYPAERKFVRTFAPASLGLFLAGAAFFYFLVLPFALRYFVQFNDSFKPPAGDYLTPVQRMIYQRDSLPPTTGPDATASLPGRLPVLVAPPADPAEGDAWIDAATGQFMYHAGGQTRIVSPIAGSLVQPWFNLADYLKFTVMLMFIFGVSFQMPLAILFLSRTRIVPADAIAGKRRVILLVVVVLAAVLTPSADVVSQLALALPMWGLFELGLLLARRWERRQAGVVMTGR